MHTYTSTVRTPTFTRLNLVGSRMISHVTGTIVIMGSHLLKSALVRIRFGHALFLAMLGFSFFLMYHTFGYNPDRQVFLIAPKCWSDFGAHIPLIRSFSLGPNAARLFSGQPVESPLFPGEPIRYHYGFYAVVGLLERLGVRIDAALNIPSALGMTLLMGGIYLVAARVFRSRAVGVLSVVLFLFHGSLAFLKFFSDHPLSLQTVHDIVTNSRFSTFGPWDGNVVSAFWSLNIYTNQRHLALSYAMVLFLLVRLGYAGSPSPDARETRRVSLTAFPSDIWRNSLTYAGLAAGLLFINHAVLGMFGVFALWAFLTIPSSRKPLVVAAFLTVPFFLFVRHSAQLPMNIQFRPGYLIGIPLSAGSFIRYWVHNLGLHVALIPIGLLLADRGTKTRFIIPLLVLFAAPNIWQFSPDMINNHKFFNFFMIIGSMFSASLLITLWQKARTLRRASRYIAVGFHSVVLILLTASGIIDFFPIMNESKGELRDIGSDPDADFILRSTEPEAIVLNSYWFYHPALIAGRSVYSGYPYFTWSYGYDKDQRENLAREVYGASTLDQVCRLVSERGIAVVELHPNPEYVTPNWKLWQSVQPDYVSDSQLSKYFISESLCQNTEAF